MYSFIHFVFNPIINTKELKCFVLVEKYKSVTPKTTAKTSSAPAGGVSSNPLDSLDCKNLSYPKSASHVYFIVF